MEIDRGKQGIFSAQLKDMAETFYNNSPRQMYHFIRGKVLGHSKNLNFDKNHPCVFVLSTGRTGTETLSELFGLSNKVFSYHEPEPKLYGLSKLAYEHSHEPVAQKILTEAFDAARKNLLKYSLDCNRGYVETSPQITFLAPVILNAYPSTRFIHIIRDPRHVVRSGMRRRWFSGNSADKTRITPLADSDAFQKWHQYTAFQKNLWLWTETNRWIKQFCSTIPPENVLFLRSEDVFEAESGAVEKLFDFIGAPLPSDRRIHRLLGKKLNAQKTGEFPTASIWTESMNSDLTAMTGDIAQSLGYILSTDS
jgi:hypothetical protein